MVKTNTKEEKNSLMWLVIAILSVSFFIFAGFIRITNFEGEKMNFIVSIFAVILAIMLYIAYYYSSKVRKLNKSMKEKSKTKKREEENSLFWFVSAILFVILFILAGLIRVTDFFREELSLPLLIFSVILGLTIITLLVRIYKNK